MATALPGPSQPRTPARRDGCAPIAGYAAIGNKHTAGLVALDGTNVLETTFETDTSRS